MGGTNAKMNDHQLNELLLRTREEAVLPASFQRGVWQAIAARAAQREARWGWLDNLLGVLAKPLPAAAVWSLALMAGLLAGTLKPLPPSHVVRVAAYAHSINPLAKIPAP